MMMFWGDDFAYMNAKAQFEQLEKIIEVCNRVNTNNMKFIMSNPSAYVNAVKKENIEWPVKTFDLVPYGMDNDYFWSGFYSSRPSLKKHIRDASSIYSAENSLLARKVIR